MSTMQKIAEIIGVSKATVSRALNGTGYVRQDTRRRILQVAENLGYRPNLLAKNLATKKSKCVGLVMANKMLDGHYAHEIVTFCAKKLQDHGMELLLADGKNSAEGEQAAITLLIGLRCDAILLYSHSLPTEDIENIIEKTAIPIIVINRILPQHPENMICCDHQGDAYRAAQCLLTQGYQHIAMIDGCLNSPTARSRQAGYHQALTEANLGNKPITVEGNWTLVSGYQAMINLLELHPDIDAVLAANDEMAMGAMRYLHEIGKKIPEDIAIIGFDNAPIAAFLTPSLSSVKAPTQAMFDLAISQLFNLTEGLPLEAMSLFNSEVILRESVDKKTNASIP